MLLSSMAVSICNDTYTEQVHQFDKTRLCQLHPLKMQLTNLKYWAGSQASSSTAFIFTIFLQNTTCTGL